MIFYYRVSRRRYTLFRQILFVLQAVPDILDIVVVLQRVQQLAHCLELIGVGQLKAMGKLLDALEDNDDVQNVWHSLENEEDLPE